MVKSLYELNKDGKLDEYTEAFSKMFTTLCSYGVEITESKDMNVWNIVVPYKSEILDDNGIPIEGEYCAKLSKILIEEFNQKFSQYNIKDPVVQYVVKDITWTKEMSKAMIDHVNNLKRENNG